MKNILQKILAVLARATIRRYGPMVIGITGSVGKTSAREAIFAVLRKKYRVRNPEKNYNNEIGLPLTILGIPNADKNIFAWIANLIKSCLRIIFKQKNYPEILLLEYGVDRPRDMEHLISIARPNMAVMTAIGELPVHIEFFRDSQALAREKAKLIKSLLSDGCAILNGDDPVVYDMRNLTDAKILTYGFSEKSGVRIINYEMHFRPDAEFGEAPDGISFKIAHAGSVMPVRLRGTLGEPQVYAAVAACAVGIALGINLVEIAEALAEWSPPAGRLRLLKGVKNSLILDDTYNAGPASVHAALNVLRSLSGRRKIAVLGDILELGNFTEQAHRAAGKQVSGIADLLFVVGARAKFIADEAAQTGMAHNRIFKFDNPVSAGKALDAEIKKGDLILIKGSQGMRMEKTVEEVMARPELAGELLTRQDKNWKNKPFVV